MLQYEALRQDLSHIYWIGGSPCSGKSSIADSLAQSYRLPVYRGDDAFFEHEKIITQDKQPVFHKLTHLSSDELWMRPVDQQIAEEIALYREEFPLILQDLLTLPATHPIIAEGAALLPEQVCQLLSDPRRAIWIVPTAEFQQHHYPRRDWTHDIVAACTDPEQAFQNWMQRDIGFATFIASQATEQGMRVLLVDGKRSLAENIASVEQHFQL
jgi:hypothetical protein